MKKWYFSAKKILGSSNQGMIEQFEKRGVDLKKLEKNGFKKHERKFYWSEDKNNECIKSI